MSVLCYYCTALTSSDLTFSHKNMSVFLSINESQVTLYEGRLINKLKKQRLSVSIPNIKKSIIYSTSCEFYYDDVTVTSFINIKYGNVAVEVVS